MQEYMKLSVIASSKSVLEQKIIVQTAQMTYYSNMVENVKKGNETVFKDIYSVLDVSQKTKQPVSNEQLCEFKPDTNLRPAPLTFQSSLIETHQFYAQFERYVKTSNSLPDGIIYSQTIWKNTSSHKLKIMALTEIQVYKTLFA